MTMADTFPAISVQNEGPDPKRYWSLAVVALAQLMIVLDASAAIDWLLQTPAGKRIEQRIFVRRETLHTLHLLDVEFVQVLRRLVRNGTLAGRRAEEAVEDLGALNIARYPPVVLLKRIWRLRQNLSAYDAAYVALAEELNAPLITRDRRIATAPGHLASVEVF